MGPPPMAALNFPHSCSTPLHSEAILRIAARVILPSGFCGREFSSALFEILLFLTARYLWVGLMFSKSSLFTTRVSSP
jgi:hypothetical protein